MRECRLWGLAGASPTYPQVVGYTRAMMLIDRENGRGAAVTFCETEDDLRKVDEYMNNMSAPSGAGTRSSVEMYEVAVDSEQL